MKRITLFVALIVCVTSFGVLAEKTPYWEGFMEIPQIEHPLNHGEINLRLQPFEFNNGEMLNNGIEGQLFINYGLSANTELKAYLIDTKEYYGYNSLSSQTVNASIKHKLIDQNGSSFSIIGEMNLERLPKYETQTWTPSVGLLFSKILNKGLKFNNNAYFSFYPTGNVGITLENGLAYVINPQNIVKARLETYLIDLNNVSNNLKVAYRTHITDKLNYTLVIDKTFAVQNTHLANIFEFTPISDLKLTGKYDFNTHTSHWIQVRADKRLTNHLTLVGQYDKQLLYNGYSSLITGVNFNF